MSDEISTNRIYDGASLDELHSIRRTTVCPWRDVDEMLHSAGMRPTRQRLALGWLLFETGPRHLTAEMLYGEASIARVGTSLATVYNTLNQLTEAGFLTQISVDGSKTYFDTNVRPHHHFYLEHSHELIDIPDLDLSLDRIPDVPEGYEVGRVEVIIRLKRIVVKRPDFLSTV
jgi:Fur family iron response transcriptional regulator